MILYLLSMRCDLRLIDETVKMYRNDMIELIPLIYGALFICIYLLNGEEKNRTKEVNVSSFKFKFFK